MARPPSCREVGAVPPSLLFRPASLNSDPQREVLLGLDELHAIRLADLEGLYQEEAAERMGVSRPTFGRIIETARRKVASALVGGWSLRIVSSPAACGDPCTCDDDHPGRHRDADRIADEDANDARPSPTQVVPPKEKP